MSKYLAIILLPLFLFACDVTIDPDWYNDTRAEETVSRYFSSSQIRKVSVKTRNGTIEAVAWDDSSIDATFEKTATGHDREDAEDNLDKIRIHTDRNTASGVLTIDVEFPNHVSGENYGCSVYLILPASLALELESSNGSITAIGIENDLDFSTSNGAIKIEDTEGYAYLRTSNGKITVDNHHGELDSRTSNGKVDADIVLPIQGECILKTSNGPITLSIPDTTSARMEASTSNGRIEIEDLPVTISMMEKTEFGGQIGSGRGTIDLSTSNGNIVIRNRY
jgi:DUF4097 and DUF4098 domain-containing protein YvlB